MDVLIRTREVCKIFNRRRPDEFTALRDVSLSVGRGELVVLRGPSGSGKTSLLSLIGCMARPTSGRIEVGGQDVGRLPERFLASIRRNDFGFIFQQFNLLRDLSVRDNIQLPLYATSLKTAEIRHRTDAVLEQFGLGPRESARVRQLSGGEQQRVAIARALVNQPRLIIADEPTAHLDSRLTEELFAILTRLKGEGKTIVIATHDPVVYQHPLVDRSYLMDHGSLSEVPVP